MIKVKVFEKYAILKGQGHMMLNNGLFMVLCPTRERDVTVIGNIRAMYRQFLTYTRHSWRLKCESSLAYVPHLL